MIKAIVMFILVTLAIAVPFIAKYGLKLSGKSMKTAMVVNLFSFFTLMLVFAACLVTGSYNAFAATEGAVASSAEGMKFLGAALSTGLACVGAGIAVSSSASAALGAISEDPQIMGKSLIFVALAEGIAIYGLIISLLILFQ